MDNNQIEEYFNHKDNCIQDIGAARKAFGSARTTEEQYDAMEKGLALMSLYCPEEMKHMVDAVMMEAAWRRVYYIPRWAGVGT